MSVLYKAFPQGNWFYFSLYETDQNEKKKKKSFFLSQIQFKWNKSDMYLQVFKVP